MSVGASGAGRDGDAIRMIGVHEPGVVAEAVTGEQRQLRPAHLPERRPIADRPDAGDAVERLESAQQARLLLGRRRAP